MCLGPGADDEGLSPPPLCFVVIWSSNQRWKQNKGYNVSCWLFAGRRPAHWALMSHQTLDNYLNSSCSLLPMFGSSEPLDPVYSTEKAQTKLLPLRAGVFKEATVTDLLDCCPCFGERTSSLSRLKEAAVMNINELINFKQLVCPTTPTWSWWELTGVDGVYPRVRLRTPCVWRFVLVFPICLCCQIKSKHAEIHWVELSSSFSPTPVVLKDLEQSEMMCSVNVSLP